MITEEDRRIMNNFINHLISLLMMMKEPLIIERNKIIDSVFLKFLCRRQFRMIDDHLDIIDRTIYELQKRLSI